MRRVFVWIFLLFLNFFTACHNSPVVVEQHTHHALGSVLVGQVVFLLTPQVTFKRIEDETSIPPETLIERFGGEPRETLLASIVEKKLSDKGLEVFRSEKLNALQEIQIKDLLADLKENYRILISAYKDKSDMIPILKQLHSISGSHLVCIATLTVKVGKGAYFEPFFGATAPGTHSSDFKVVLVSLPTGEHIWRNEVYIRKLPTDETIANSMEILLQSL